MSYDIDYLNLLSQQFPTIKAASREIIHLQAMQKLPKLTEHFMSDIHGEYESFLHILKNASGVIKDKITMVYGRTLSNHDRQILATLIYYPEQKLDLIKSEIEDIDDWYRITLYRLIEVCRVMAAKYTRAKVRSFLPQAFGSTIDELIHADTDYGSDKSSYYNETISTIVELGQSDAFIVDISSLIKTLAVGRLHIIGDIFDRGPRADIILDTLLDYHCLDIQWGNHDVEWMGAAAGSLACIANVISISTKYSNFDCLEDGYGINMRPLTVFALETYGEDQCQCFMLRNPNQVHLTRHDESVWAKIHKAISIIQFKLEGQLILRHPEFEMDNHLMLDKINYTDGTITLEGKTYKLKDTNFPTVNPNNPYELTEDEAELMELLRASFLRSEKLQRHIAFLYNKGSMYRAYNNNLLYHGCIPMNADGTFREVTLAGQKVKGKSLMDLADKLARSGYLGKEGSEEKAYGEDFLWYLWCGCNSPVYGKNKMTSFERYFIEDEDTWVEIKDNYYTLVEKSSVCNMILSEFGIDHKDFSHIVNGHVPVKIKKGESPIKAGGKLLVIDGGLSRAYQTVTGLAGYTLLFNSHGLLLSAHDTFVSSQSAINQESDIYSTLEVIDMAPRRLLVADTDAGKLQQKKIQDLKALVSAYRSGKIRQL